MITGFDVAIFSDRDLDQTRCTRLEYVYFRV